MKNISGTIVVETWKRDEIRLSATIESKNAQVIPRQTDQSLVVDVMSDNRGKGDVGDINFKLQVPVNSNVDLETRRGNISVANIRSGLVRAHVSSEGDIELTNVVASHVIAQNVMGDIFFDGEFSTRRHLRVQIQQRQHHDSHSRRFGVPLSRRIAGAQNHARRFLEQWFQNAGRKKVRRRRWRRPLVCIRHQLHRPDHVYAQVALRV